MIDWTGNRDIDMFDWTEALWRADLPASAFKVGLCLMFKFRNRKTGKLCPSFPAIGLETGLPEGTVRRGVDGLRCAGLLSSQKLQYQGSLAFFLTLPKADQSVQKRTDSNLSKNERPICPKSDAQSVQFWTLEPIEGTRRKEPEEGRDPQPGSDALRAGPAALSSLRSDLPFASSELGEDDDDTVIERRNRR